MTSPENTLSQTEDVPMQIDRLREQVESLLRDRVSPAMASALDTAGAVARDAATTARHQAEALSGKVREQPLMALLVAGVVGFLVGRSLR